MGLPVAVICMEMLLTYMKIWGGIGGSTPRVLHIQKLYQVLPSM